MHGKSDRGEATPSSPVPASRHSEPHDIPFPGNKGSFGKTNGQLAFQQFNVWRTLLGSGRRSKFELGRSFPSKTSDFRRFVRRFRTPESDEGGYREGGVSAILRWMKGANI